MQKEIIYLIYYLSLTSDNKNRYYSLLLKHLKKSDIFNHHFSNTKILRITAANDGIKIVDSFSIAQDRLDTILTQIIPEYIKEAKDSIFSTLIKSNFQKEKEHFDKVETSIYKCLQAYIIALSRALEIYYLFIASPTSKEQVAFAKDLHEYLVKIVFNEAERDVMEDKLDTLMAVYLSLYARYEKAIASVEW